MRCGGVAIWTRIAVGHCMDLRNNLLDFNPLPDWHRDHRPDRRHPHRRRYTRGYRAKRQLAQTCWVCGGLLVLHYPTLSVLLVIGLASTFLSFMLLDETD